MIQNRPVFMLDTGAYNRLLKVGLQSEVIYAAFKTGYHVRLAGISIEELMSTGTDTHSAAPISGPLTPRSDKIAAQLNSEGVLTRTGKRWHGVVVNRILTGESR